MIGTKVVKKVFYDIFFISTKFFVTPAEPVIVSSARPGARVAVPIRQCQTHGPVSKGPFSSMVYAEDTWITASLRCQLVVG
jgi:hypothetical protein